MTYIVGIQVSYIVFQFVPGDAIYLSLDIVCMSVLSHILSSCLAWPGLAPSILVYKRVLKGLIPHQSTKANILVF